MSDALHRPASAPRVALVHDFLLDLRGAERVFVQICDIWPDADIFTAVYDERGTEGRFADRQIHSSFLQHLRPSDRNFRAFLPLYPSAIESFDFSDYDLIVSSSSAWAHGVVCDTRSVHVTYCHNPFRYAWNDLHQTLARRGDPVSRALLRAAFARWRRWDQAAAQRADRYVANSGTTQARIREYFGRDARIVHPPVDTRRFTPGPVGDHYLVISELMAHKHIDVAVEAFNRLRLPLIVIGDGPEFRHLKQAANGSIRLVGRLPDRAVAELIQSARALIVTAVEEFGIVSVESQAAGRPVIALKGGGALETIVDGVTGCFWTGGPSGLAKAVLEFDDQNIDPRRCTDNAARFDVSRFRTKMLDEVGAAIESHRESLHARRRHEPPGRAMRRAIRVATGHGVTQTAPMARAATGRFGRPPLGQLQASDGHLSRSPSH